MQSTGGTAGTSAPASHDLGVLHVHDQITIHVEHAWAHAVTHICHAVKERKRLLACFSVNCTAEVFINWQARIQHSCIIRICQACVVVVDMPYVYM